MKKSPNQEIRLLLQLINEAFQDRAWHGPNLRSSIRGLTLEQASWRPAPNRHNIWEIVVHAAYWKYVIRRKLLREKKGSFPLKGSNWIKRSLEMGKKTWIEDLRLLEDTHISMCKAIAQLKPADLKKKTINRSMTNRSSISGIACHDVYHAGQIQLLKRLMH